MTGAELDAAVKSLRSVGGVYEFVAWWVEHINRPHVTEEGVLMPRDKRLYMTFPIDFHRHPKFVILPKSASWLWLSSIAWCATDSPDLWIPRSARLSLGGSASDARQLSRAGLWLPDKRDGESGHWLIRNDMWRISRDYREGVPTWMREAVLNRDGHMCLSCGTNDDLQMDHIYPWSLGGPTTIENLQTLCGPCNRRKGAKIDGLAEDR